MRPTIELDKMNQSHHYWGLPSATIDWCEDNYQVSGYAAEFYNSFSSLIYVALAIFVYYKCTRYGYMRTGYIMAIFMMVLVGLGSVAFHATLLYEMQLLDELPMIYGASTILYLAFDPRSQWSRRMKMLLLTLLTAASMLFTFIYVVIRRDPFLHQSYFALLLILFTLVTGWQVAHLTSSSIAVGESQLTAPLYRLLGKGCLILVLAKLIWTIDNEYCAQLSHIRKMYLSFPFDCFLQFHMIWHMLSALALHYLVSVSIYIRESSQEELDRDYKIAYTCYIIPYICPKSIIRYKAV